MRIDIVKDTVLELDQVAVPIPDLIPIPGLIPVLVIIRDMVGVGALLDEGITVSVLVPVPDQVALLILVTVPLPGFHRLARKLSSPFPP